MEELFLPTLFAVLAGFVAVNIVINLVLLYIRRERINLLLSLYWPLVLAVFLLQSRFQTGNLAVSMAYSVSLLPMIIISIIGFETAGRAFPLHRYLWLSAAAYPLTLLFALAGYRFEIVAAPFSLITAFATGQAGWVILFAERARTTKLQKLFGIVTLAMSVHCINFALFRMQPGSQLWGWLVAYAIYDSLAIILPSLALENVYLTERERLQTLIRERTADLDRSLQDNRSLLKILLHDMHNPMSAMALLIQALHPGDVQGRKLVRELRGAHAELEQIVAGAKQLYLNRDTGAVEAVPLEHCFGELQRMFGPELHRKGVRLRCASQLETGAGVLVERSLLLHSILGNLVSNAVKFSPPGGAIDLTVAVEDGKACVEVRDEGGGIPAEVLRQLDDDGRVRSRPGTANEQGSGLGLSIARAVVEACGGSMEIESCEAGRGRGNGTCVRVFLQLAMPHSSKHPMLECVA